MGMESMTLTLHSIGRQFLQLNTFQLYSNNSNHSLYNKYEYKYSLPFERIPDVVPATQLLQRTWYHSITISILYFLMIKRTQRFMEHRPAFNLRRELFVWNVFLAAFSFVGFARQFEELANSFMTFGVYRSVCYSIDPEGVAGFWAILFAFSKIIEFGDTMFIVLRKKPLIFLHYYHHVVVLVGSAHSGAEHAAPARIFMCLNFFVHFVMYSYYASTAYGIKHSKTTSKLVTSLQIVQMLVGVYVEYLVLDYKAVQNRPCQQTYTSFAVMFTQYASFAVLFIQFYVNAYYLNPKKTIKAE